MPPPLLQSLFSPAAISLHLPSLALSKKSLFPSPAPSSRSPRCSLLSTPTEAPPGTEAPRTRPSPAEVSRTIVELSSTGTLTALTHEGGPLGVCARFVVDTEGVPAVSLNHPERLFTVDGLSSFHVQFEQSGSRTPQCTLLGRLSKLEDTFLLKKLDMKWEKKFGEKFQGDLIYLLSVEKVLHIEDFKEDGVWVASSEYLNAEPDPLRNFAEKIVEEMNTKHIEDVQRLCNIYVDSEFQGVCECGCEEDDYLRPIVLCGFVPKVNDAKIIWVDRLGFDMYIHSEKEVFVARIPFPREVTDEKGVKSSFNSMTHLAWEIKKNYATPDFEKVKFLKKIR